MLVFGILCMAFFAMANLVYSYKVWELLGYRWWWGSDSSNFFRAVFVAPVLEESTYRLMSVGIVYHFYGFTSVELWKMVGMSSLIWAASHYNRGFLLVVINYLPVGFAYATIFIVASEITDVAYGYGAVVLLHGAYNFIVCVGPPRMRFQMR